MQGSSENEANVRVFGKEHRGYVRGTRLGVNPTQVLGFSSQSTRSTSSFEANAKMEKMQSQINSLKAQVAEVEVLKAQVAEVEVLKKQIAFLLQNANRNEVNNLLLTFLLQLFIHI